VFHAAQGPALLGFLALAAVLSALAFVGLTILPQRARKPLIALVTFLAGLIYAAEWVIPVGGDGKTNLLTPYLKSFADIVTVLQGFALGIGVYSLVAVHLRSIVRRREGWPNSIVLLGSVLVMALPALLKEDHPNRYNKNLFAIAFDGGYSSLNAAMFSVVAFYIVSAAYRAFRIRSLESSILLLSALLIMLGQVALGQWLTSGIPNQGFAANFRVENVAGWILNKVSSPAIQAVEFGVGIGTLATALRLWLSLERGSYFEETL
jgi:hypothetical protein